MSTRMPVRQLVSIALPIALVIAASVGWWRGTAVSQGGPHPLGRAESAAAAGSITRPVPAGFDAWRELWRTSSPDGRDALIADGVKAADERQRELATLMRSDPGRALASVMSITDLAGLPDAVRARCEQPFNGTGGIDLLWSTSIREDGSLDCHHQQQVHAGGRVWPARFANRAEPHMPLSGVLLDGYVIDGELLLSPRPLRVLKPGETAAATAFFPSGGDLDPVTGGVPDETTAAVLGGRIYRFEGPASLEQVVRQLESRADLTVKNGGRMFDSGFAWLEAEGGDVPGMPAGGNEESPWMPDTVDALFIRVDFSDFPGAPISQADLQSALTSVGAHLQNYSYGAASLVPTVTSQVYRMPNSGTIYATSQTGAVDLISAARAAAAANYTLENYDVVAVYFPSLMGVPGSYFSWAGLASVGGSNHWINGVNTSNRVPVILHEFGHNFGLFHANYWDPSQGIGSGSYQDPAASSLEYGDIFDRMGGGGAAEGYFSPYATNRLNWLPGSKIVQPSADGTWRIHRFDQPAATANPTLALRIPLGSEKYFWVGHRKLYPSAPYNLANGAYVVAEGYYIDRPNLIDMTPGSQSPETNDRNDAGLVVGSTYHDSTSGTHITTMAAGGTAPNEWIDVKVDFDPRIGIVNSSVAVNESAGNAVVTVRRSMDSAGACSVNYTTAPGTATAGTDYLTVSGTLSWAAGDADDKSVLVPIRPDSTVESTEALTLSISAPSGAVIAGSTTATIEIRDAGQRMAEFAPPFFNTAVYAIAPLADGKVIIGGYLDGGITGHIARLNADGSEDVTFGKGTGFNGDVRALLLQPDGKILVGGSFTSYNSTACNRLVRLNPNGAVDTAFVTASGGGADATVRALAMEAGGGILVGGDFANFNGSASEGLVRLLASGARNPVALNLPYTIGWNTSIRSILVQEDGEIMTAGSLYLGWTGTGFRSGVARLNTDGANDSTFNPDAGAHLAGNTSSLRTVETIIRQPDGKYIIGGQFTAYDENAAPQIARVNSNGSFDPSFVPPGFANTVATLLLQPTGKVVVGGWFSSPVGYLERLLPAGGSDGSFNQGTGPAGSVYALARDASGGIWVGGNFFTYNGTACRPIVKISSGLNAYDAWADTVFAQSQFAAGSAAAGADADGDGRPNIIELLAGSNPNSAGAASLVAQTFATAGSNTHLQASLSRNSAGAGLWIMAQFGNDLTGWFPSPPATGTNAVYDIVEDNSSRFTVRDKTASGSAPRRFVRFVVGVPQ